MSGLLLFKDQQFGLDLSPCDLKIYRVHLLSRVIHCIKFSNFPEKSSQEILSRHHLYKDRQFDLALWPCDFKINREHLFSRGIHCTKFANFQAEGFKDIERTSFSLQTDRQAQNNIPFLNLKFHFWGLS